MKILKFRKKFINYLNINNTNSTQTTNIASHKNVIYFLKTELTLILSLYSKQVSSGLWRDYAIDSKNDVIIFSIYRHTHDIALYQIIKTSKKGQRDKPIFFIKQHNQILDKSNTLNQMLSRFENKIKLKNYN